MGAKTDSYQLGLSANPANNFTLVTDAAGGFKIARGNPGATTQDILVVDANGRIQTFGVASAFSAHNNGVVQSIPGQAVAQLNFSAERYDLGNDFASSAWTPPGGRPILMTAAATMTLNNSAWFIAIYKNGIELARGTRTDNATGSPTTVVSAQDVPSGTDVYTVRVYQGTGGALNTIGNPELTYFQGVRL